MGHVRVKALIWQDVEVREQLSRRCGCDQRKKTEIFSIANGKGVNDLLV